MNHPFTGSSENLKTETVGNGLFPKRKVGWVLWGKRKRDAFWENGKRCISDKKCSKNIKT